MVAWRQNRDRDISLWRSRRIHLRISVLRAWYYCFALFSFSRGDLLRSRVPEERFALMLVPAGTFDD